MSLAMILCIAAFVIHRVGVGSPRLFIISAGGIMGAGVFLCFIFKKNKGKIAFDERDKLIDKNAHLAGFGAVYLLVILVSYVPIAIAPEASIPTKWFPFLLPSAVLCQAYAISLAILIQYGRGGKDGRE
jgi:hypothetical protein